MWDEQILGILDVTPEQRKIFRVSMKHRNNRLVTDGPATSYRSMWLTCLIYSPSLWHKKITLKKKETWLFKMMPVCMCSKTKPVEQRGTKTPLHYEEHLKLLSWMWFKKEERPGIKWNQMSALLKLESRSRDEHASVWGRVIKTVSWGFNIISEKKVLWTGENSREREAAPFRS